MCVCKTDCDGLVQAQKIWNVATMETAIILFHYLISMDHLSTPTSFVCHTANRPYALYVSITVAMVLILISVVVAVR